MQLAAADGDASERTPVPFCRADFADCGFVFLRAWWICIAIFFSSSDEMEPEEMAKNVDACYKVFDTFF